MNRQQWLNLEHNPLVELCPKTNQQILDMPTEERPEDWFDPYILTPQEIDKMRVEFKGSSLKWQQYVEEKLPTLNPQEERRTKKEIDDLKAAAECGTKRKRRMSKQGIPGYGPWTCNRYHLCPKCVARRQDQHFDRLMRLDGQPYVVNQRAEMVATYSKDNVYSYELPNGDEITIIITDEKIEGASEMSYEVAKQHKDFKITKSKVSGNAGKPLEKTEEKESRTVTLISPDFQTSEEIENRIEQEYLEATKDFEPYDLDAATKLLLACQSIWFAIIRKYCEEIHFTERYNLKITQDDLDWTKRKEYVQRRLMTVRKE